MFDIDALTTAVAIILNFKYIILITFGVIYGIFCGALPGFSATMAVAIALPATFAMEALPALVLLGATYAGAAYGGSISAILLNTPGTPEAAATCIEGYELTKKGLGNLALGGSNGASFIGGLLSYITMLFIMYPLARFALTFGSPELFLLAVFGLSIIVYLRGETLAKGYLAASFGFLVGTTGMATSGKLRATFGIPDIMDGMPMIPIIIGMFAFAEILLMLEKEYVTGKDIKTPASFSQQIKGIIKVFSYPITILRSTIIGIVVGAIPAVGSTVASFVAYNETKRNSKDKDSFGKGNFEGVVGCEAANNACTGGALATMFALGIPGSSTTAIIMAAMMLHGVTPGPRVLVQQMDLVYAVLFSLVLAQIVLVIGGLTMSYGFSKVILDIPTKTLAPFIMIFAVVGTYAIHNSFIDVWIMVIFGILAWLMKKSGFPPIATVLGIILAPMADREFILTYIRYGGDFTIFFKRPLSLMIIGVIVITVILPSVISYINKKRNLKNSTITI